MTPLDRLRIEKAAADCGFEMTPLARDGGLELRSARFPETVLVRLAASSALTVSSSSAGLLGTSDGVSVVAVDGFGALYDMLRTAAAHARTLPNRVADAFRRETAGMPRTTETERVVVQRVGQNLFRAALLDYWQGRCCVTGLDVPELLRASHIKPWAASESDDERLDVFNGLLLAPNLDALFDTGLMTVLDDGTVCLAGELTPNRRRQLGLVEGMTVAALRPWHHKYLQFHRQRVWRCFC
jgi:hypothetical protein